MTVTNPEQALINGLMGQTEIRVFESLFMSGLSPQHFRDSNLASMWNACEKLAIEHDKVPCPVGVADEMAKVGITNYTLEREVVSQEQLESYAEIIKRQYKIDTIRGHVQCADEAFSSKPEDVDAIADGLATHITDTIQPEPEVSSVMEICQSVIDNVAQASLRGGVVEGHPTGIDGVDRWLGAYAPSSYNVIAGPPGTYKTSFVRTLALCMASRGVNVDVYTLEQTREQIIEGMLGQIAMHDMFTAKLGKNEDKHGNLPDAARRLSGLPITIFDQNMTPSRLKASIKRRKDKTDVVFVDYIQALAWEHDTQNDIVHAEKCTRAIKDAAKDYRMPIVAISSLSNDGNYRYSRQVEYDAYTILRLSREDDEDRSNPNIVVEVAKNRFGPCGQRVMLKRDDYGNIVEV